MFGLKIVDFQLRIVCLVFPRAKLLRYNFQDPKQIDAACVYLLQELLLPLSAGTFQLLGMSAWNPLGADEEPLLNGTEAQNSYPLKNLGNTSPRFSREEQDGYLFANSHSGRQEHTLTGRNYLKWPILKRLRPVIEWCIGPQPPRFYKIKPIYADAQTVLPNLLKRIRSSELRVALLLAVYGCWITIVVVLLLASSLLCFDSGYRRPVRLSCTSRFW